MIAFCPWFILSETGFHIFRKGGIIGKYIVTLGVPPVNKGCGFPGERERSVYIVQNAVAIFIKRVDIKKFLPRKLDRNFLFYLSLIFKKPVLNIPELLGEIHIIIMRIFKPLYLIPQAIHLLETVVLNLFNGR